MTEENPGWKTMGGPDQPFEIPQVRKQADLLIMLRGVMEQALAAKEKELERLQVSLERIRHGGGQ